MPNPSAAVDCLPLPADNSKEVLICHEKWWSKSVLVYALHSLEYVLGLARFRVFVPNLNRSAENLYDFVRLVLDFESLSKADSI